MTREEAIIRLKEGEPFCEIYNPVWDEALDMAIKALEQEPCEDAISRQAVLDELNKWDWQELYLPIHFKENIIDVVPSVNPQEPKTGHCRDCKWWKDKDGEYRRGVRAESKCLINCRKVYEGDGYCFMFEPQESEGEA